MNQVEIYAAEKRMSLLLNEKFEMQKELHALLCGEQKETIEAYTRLFDVMDEVIIQEAKSIDIDKNKNAAHNRELDEQRLNETSNVIAKKIFVELKTRVVDDTKG